MRREKLIYLVITIFSCLFIVYDFFITKVFGIESGYVILICPILILNLVRLLSAWIVLDKLDSLINGIIILTVLFNFSIIALLLFGYGFTGAVIPKVWILGFILNLSIFIMAFYDLIIFNKNTKHNTS